LVGTSFLIDLPYINHPQAAKQAAKIWHFAFKKSVEMPAKLEHLFNFSYTKNGVLDKTASKV